MMLASKSPIRALGEIALRVNDLDAMQTFYQDVIGLELMKRFESAVFFKIAPGHAGHTQILALFDRSADRDDSRRFVRATPGGVGQEHSTLDHLAFAIDLGDYDKELERLHGLGCDVSTAEHAWVKWRSIYVSDPEGNVVELVCYDGGIQMRTRSVATL